MKCSLGISNFLEEISSLSNSVVFLYFFVLITEEGFLISPCYSLNGVASQAPPGSQASSRGEAKDSALLSSRVAVVRWAPPHPRTEVPSVAVTPTLA